MSLENIIVTSYPYVYANEQIEDCIERIKDYSEDSIPVLDSDNKLKGVLTAQDITELVAVISYYGLAWILLINVLHF